MARKDVLHHVRRLGGVIHRERVLGRVVVGEERAPFEADAGVSSEVIGLLDHHVGFRERLVDAAAVELALEADVVAELRMNHRFAGQGFVHFHHNWQFLPLGLDQLRGVLGLTARLGDHRRHRLALPAGALDRDGVLRRRLDAFQMREHRDPRRAVLRDCAAVEDSNNPWRSQTSLEVEALDLGVSVRAAEERHMRKARKAQIVDERAAPLQQALRIRARHALTDIALVELRARCVKRKLSLHRSSGPLRSHR